MHVTFNIVVVVYFLHFFTFSVAKPVYFVEFQRSVLFEPENVGD